MTDEDLAFRIKAYLKFPHLSNIIILLFLVKSIKSIHVMMMWVLFYTKANCVYVCISLLDVFFQEFLITFYLFMLCLSYILSYFFSNRTIISSPPKSLPTDPCVQLFWPRIVVSRLSAKLSPWASFKYFLRRVVFPLGSHISVTLHFVIISFLLLL